MRYFGDYELIEVIAQGGMGVVYKARQVSLNRILALEDGARRPVCDRPTTCSDSASKPRPPLTSITPVSCRSTRSAEHDGHHYFSMKLVDGGNLAAQVERFAPSPVRRRGSRRRWPAPSITPTSAESCTAT